MRRRITLSRAVLHAGLDAVAATVGRDAVLDLRADAFGHGSAEVEAAARQHGFDTFVRADDDPSVQALDARVTSIVYGTAESATPVATVSGEVVSCKRVAAGDAVSYGYTYRLATDSTLALVGLGYADGVPRAASNRAHVLVAEARHVLAGRVAMDQFMVDIGDDAAAPGDEVVLWGARHSAPSLHDWAQASGRLPLELTTGLGVRFERVWTAS